MRYEISEITVPEQQTGPAKLTAYILDAISVAPEKKRPLVIILPGGGYQRCSDREQEPIAMQFLAMGYHAVTLKYSVSPNRFPVALRETAAAVAYVKEHAEEWQADPKTILLCGFSVGGHLACQLGQRWQDPFVYEAIGKTSEQVRPDGLILGYPVITSGAHAHTGSFIHLLGQEIFDLDRSDRQDEAAQQAREKMEEQSLEYHVNRNMPPVFLWHTMADTSVPVDGSLALALALREHRVKSEIHIYANGRHGQALSTRETAGEEAEWVIPACQNWIQMVQSWIEAEYR